MNPHQEPDKNSITLRVPGDLISTNAEALRKEAAGLLETPDGAPRKSATFILDLRAARLVDSVGLNLVVGLLKRVQKLGARMQITYSNPNVLRTFTFTRLDQHVEMVKV